MPWQNKVVLALLPVAVFVTAGGSWSDRLSSVAPILVAFLLMFVFTRWLRWHDARGAARYAARQAEHP